MCILCNGTDEEKNSEIAKLKHYIWKLKETEDFYKDVMNGNIKPHTKEYKDKEYLIRDLIRFLVNEWV